MAVESTRAYLMVPEDYVRRHGRLVALYSDRHSIFTKHEPEDHAPAQFERAVRALDIEPIQAFTPQAKGRVERLFQTLQDRLVKAMRLAQINAMDAANAFLDTYLTGHNARFAVAQEDAHRPFKDDDTALARLCAVHHERTLSKDLVLSFKGQRYIVQTHAGAPRYGLRGKKVSVIEHHDERIELICRQEVLSYRVFDPRQDRYPAVDDKTLNERVDQAGSDISFLLLLL